MKLSDVLPELQACMDKQIKKKYAVSTPKATPAVAAKAPVADAAKPAATTGPVTPVQAKPAEVKSADPKPAEVKSEVAKPAEVKATEVKPAEVKSTVEVKPAA